MLPLLSLAPIVPLVFGQAVPPPLPEEDDEELPPVSLKTVAVPEPENLDEFIRDRDAARQLGKALFWDMQVGSDGMTACASCHFNAGADNRVKNQISPGLLAGDVSFDTARPNYTLEPEDFPLRKLADPADATSQVLRNSNDVVSSQGVFLSQMHRLRYSLPWEASTDLVDPVFQVRGVNTRRVEPRNAPSVINAVFYSRLFWDGRAGPIFNGVNIHGATDDTSGILVEQDGALVKQIIRLNNASLAAQALGPPMSDVEMSHLGRSFPLVGRKLLNARPLALQFVHPQDSLLGPLSRARLNGQTLTGQRGLNTTYRRLIEAAFHPQYWSSRQIVRIDADGTVDVLPPTEQRALKEGEYTQLEANFPLFFGLALQMYESTLVADDTPFDRFLEGNATALTPRQQLGMEVFMEQGRCFACHAGAELTNATVPGSELMPTADGGLSFYDEGFYNIALRPHREDLGVGGVSSVLNPVTHEPYPLSDSARGMLKRDGLLPEGMLPFVPDLPDFDGWPDPKRMSIKGAFKTPALRNVELTGPYFHTGSYATLRQVVDFYDRGGDFRNEEIALVHPEILPLGLTNEQKEALVDFLLSLTDERVRQEQAPFDHPQLFLPHGQAGDDNEILGTDVRERNGFRNNEQWFELPAIGRDGRPAAGLPPIGRFLDLDPFSP